MNLSDREQIILAYVKENADKYSTQVECYVALNTLLQVSQADNIMELNEILTSLVKKDVLKPFVSHCGCSQQEMLHLVLNI